MEENDNLLVLSKKENKDKFLSNMGKTLIDAAGEWSDAFAELPYIGSVIKISKVGMAISDQHFIKKIGKFLEVGTYTPEEFDKFYEELDKKLIEKLASFLINTLTAIDETEKATVVGYLYKHRVKRNIDDDLMIRLCAIVNRSYLNDLKSLPEYSQIKTTNHYVADNLFSLGLLANCGIDGGNVDGSNSGTMYQLNPVGEKLLEILKTENWITT